MNIRLPKMAPANSRRVLGTFHDLCMAALSFAAANLLVSSFYYGTLISGFVEKTALFTLICVIVFRVFELNRGSWRYASISDLLAILKSVTLSVLVYVAIIFTYSRGVGFSRFVPFLTWLILILSLAGPRILYRLVKESGWIGLVSEGGRIRPGAKPILIYKANSTADAYIRAVKARPDARIYVAGIIDNEAAIGQRTFQGLKVLGRTDDIVEVIERVRSSKGLNVEELAIADHGLDNKALTKLVTLVGDAGLRVSHIPDIVGARTASLEPRPIELADLLGRPETRFDILGVTQFIEGKTVLLTGAGGSIGSELARQIASYNPRMLILADMSEHFLYEIDMELRERFPDVRLIARIADIRDSKRVEQLFAKHKPNIVFHAAAIKHVPMAQQNVAETIKTNVLGTRNCAVAAIKHKASVFVMISTDKAVNPTNVMGASKRAAETYCQALDLQGHGTRFKTVRFGNVLGSNGSVVPRFAGQIAKGGPVTVTHPNIVRFFMTIPEAVRLVLQASSIASGGTSERGKILVLDMGEPVRIADLAERMIRLAGFRPGVDIKIEYTGLRPGEKLYEELFDPREILAPSDNTPYFVASPRTVDLPVIENLIRTMELAIDRVDVDGALAGLRAAVPEFDDQSIEKKVHGPAEHSTVDSAQNGKVVPLAKPGNRSRIV
jgi:O-antigen biosynthesis protein WbqV